MSFTDFLAAHMIISAKECEGPDLTRLLGWGRADGTKDTSEEGLLNNIPKEDASFKEKMSAKGFDNSEIVALTSIESLGSIQDPETVLRFQFPKLDGYCFKLMFSDSSNQRVPFSQVIKNDAELSEVAQKFAQDPKEY